MVMMCMALFIVLVHDGLVGDVREALGFVAMRLRFAVAGVFQCAGNGINGQNDDLWFAPLSGDVAAVRNLGGRIEGHLNHLGNWFANQLFSFFL